MNLDQKKLKFITEISQFNAADYFKSPSFKLSLDMLASILETQCILFARIYPDVNNHTLQIKTHVNAQINGKNKLSYSSIELPSENTTGLIATLNQSHQELQQTQQQLFSDLFLDIPVISQNSTPYHVVPFYQNSYLIGILAFQLNRPIQFEQTFPACFQVLKSLFINVYQREQFFIEKHTYQTVLDLMPQRVFWKNRESVYMGCNKAFSTDASLSCPADIIGVTDYDIFPEQAELYRSDDSKTMTTREHLISSEEPQTHQNGQTIWLRTSKRPIINKDDKVVGIVGTYDDISELKNIQLELSLAKSDLEKRVEERTKALTEANIKLESAINELKSTQQYLVETEKMAALGTLVAGVSHEINTPLGVAVTGASHLNYISQQIKQSVENGNISRTDFCFQCDELINSSNLILKNLERAADLIHNFKMIAVDQSHDERRTIVMKKYLQDIVTTMTPETKKKNIKIFVQGDDDLAIQTYPGTIAQIFTNLISNASIHAFAHQDSGEITIHYTVKNNLLSICFKDNGVGISPDKISQIFQPFYTTNRAHGGSGLGLSIVFNLVTQKLKGKIDCISTLNQSTEFNIVIPIS